MMNVCGFEKPLNSIEIETTELVYSLVSIESLKIKETFDKIFVDGKMYVFAKNLNFSELYQTT